MNKALARQLQSDYIPGGRQLSEEEFKKLRFRRTLDDEIRQCGCSSSSDPQSGPIYCGNVAEWVAPTEDGILALCSRHFRSQRGVKTEKQAAIDRADASFDSSEL